MCAHINDYLDVSVAVVMAVWLIPSCQLWLRVFSVSLPDLHYLNSRHSVKLVDFQIFSSPLHHCTKLVMLREILLRDIFIMIGWQKCKNVAFWTNSSDFLSAMRATETHNRGPHLGWRASLIDGAICSDWIITEDDVQGSQYKYVQNTCQLSVGPHNLYHWPSLHGHIRDLLPFKQCSAWWLIFGFLLMQFL